MAATVYQFGDFELDCERFELRRRGRALRLERKPLEMLILLAASEGRLVMRSEIAQHLWDGEVFVDTEHGINTAARKVRQALGDNPDTPRFLHTVPGKGYRFEGATAKIDASTAAGTLPDAEAGKGMPVAAPAHSWPKRWVVVLCGAVAAAVVAVLALNARGGSLFDHTTRPPVHSLAVLPIENLSGDPGQNYLAEGMTDELTTMLAKDSTLRVISRTSVMQYEGVHRPVAEIARELNVDGIVEGSLARSGENVHVTLQLIDAPTDTHLWAESYERGADDLVALPEDAARSIAHVTRSMVALSPPHKYVNPAAHDAYLHGRYLWFSENSEASGQYFLKATEIQPDYAEAWSGLANYYGILTVDGRNDPRGIVGLQKAAAEKAIALNDSLAEAHLAMSASDWVVDWDLNAALSEVNRAIELDPGFAEAYHLRWKLLSMLNRPDEALRDQRKAMELDPFERPWAMALALCYARRYDDSIAEARQRLEASPDNAILEAVLALAYLGKGLPRQAVEAQQRFLMLSRKDAAAESVGRAFAEGGYKAVLRWQIGDAEARGQKQYVSPVTLSGLYAQLGDKRRAVALLNEGVAQHSPQLFEIQNDPSFDALHTDPGYRSLVRKMGLPAAY